MAATVAGLDAEVTDRCGLVLQDAGLFLRALDGLGAAVTPAVRVGLRKGLKAVGWTLIDPAIVQDADLVGLTGPALERVIDEAELYAFRRCLAGWYRVTQPHQEPVEAEPMRGGWTAEQERDVRNRVAELKAACDVPYREPTEPAVVLPRQDGPGLYPGPWGWGVCPW